MTTDNWRGEERREHDLACEARLEKCVEKLQNWVRDQICLATKGTKIWNRYMRPIMMLLLASAVAGHFIPDSSKSAEHKLQDKEQEMRIQQMEKEVITHENRIIKMEDNVQQIMIDVSVQTQILKGLAEKLHVPVPASQPNGGGDGN